jgi:hypothetical protein
MSGSVVMSQEAFNELSAKAALVEKDAWANELIREAAELVRTKPEQVQITELKSQLSALQSDNDTLRAALEVISILRPSRPPDDITEKLYAEYTDAERAIFDRGENHGHSRAWQSAATKASEALSTTRGRG